eukprot:gb/GECG01010790.1/.p1 GENE.gb/GECG01010790.1/~~gb/GECG01010790.1/.p1  ORF type:complete len:629 (+),score=119.97 gb/GECG01010790.1/:1-1887(+)
MFYSQVILAKKGPLGKVWLAAHWDKKLSKSQISEADIEKSVESIMKPQVPLALRVSGHLLLGIARIFSRKVKYLYIDCSEALTKIKMAFRPAAVDLPSEEQVADYRNINLQQGNTNDPLQLGLDIDDENFGRELELNFDTSQFESNNEWTVVSNQHTAREEDITLERDQMAPSMNEYNLDSTRDSASRESLDYEEHRAANVRESLESLRGDANLERPSLTLDDINRDLEESQEAEAQGGRVSLAGVEKDRVNASFDAGDYGSMDDTMMMGDTDESGVNLGEGEEAAYAATGRQQRVNMPSLATAADLEQDQPETQQGETGRKARQGRKRAPKPTVDSETILPARTIKSWLADTSDTLRPRWRGWQKSRAASYWSGHRERGYCGTEQDATKSLKQSSLLGIREGSLADTFAFHASLKGDEFPQRPDVETEEDVVPHLGYEHTQAEEEQQQQQEHEFEQDAFADGFGDMNQANMFEFDQQMESISPGATSGTPRTKESSTRRPVQVTAESMGHRLTSAFAEADGDLSSSRYGTESSEMQAKSSDRWHPRTRKFAEALAEKFSSDRDSVKLNEFVAGATRKTVAASFFETLVLKSLDVVDVEQGRAYEDISINKSSTFDEWVHYPRATQEE